MVTLFTQKDFWIISFATFARYGIFAAFQALWAGPYLMEVMGYSALTAGNLIFLLNVGMILGAPCWGMVSDRLFNTRKWIIVGRLDYYFADDNHFGHDSARHPFAGFGAAVFLLWIF